MGPPTVPKLMNSNSGGAQYILKNVNATFWDKVEKDCENLFYEITQINNIKKQQDSTYHELQIWCADMWAVLWNAWINGYETKVIPEMDFCWATDNINDWDIKTIFHNAGVTCSCGRQFYKAQYRDSLPYNIEQESYRDNVCGYNYVKEVIETSKKTVLI